jgi:hypothetical protein
MDSTSPSEFFNADPLFATVVNKQYAIYLQTPTPTECDQYALDTHGYDLHIRVRDTVAVIYAVPYYWNTIRDLLNQRIGRTGEVISDTQMVWN